METGKGWHEWFMSRDYVTKALYQLDLYGVKPERIQIVQMNDKMKKDAGTSVDLVMYYYIDF